MTERRSSTDEVRVSLIDKEAIDIESRTRPTTAADKISTQFKNAFRVLEVQSAPFIQHSKFRLYAAIFAIGCLLVFSFTFKSSPPENIGTGNVSRFYRFQRCSFD